MLPSRFGFLPYAHGCNVAVWSDVVADIGGWDEEFVGGGDDVDFSWRAQLAGYRLVHAPAAVAYYRQRTSLAGLAIQMYGYGRADARLLRRFAPFGAQARPFGAFIRSLWWLGSRLPFAGMDNSRRGRWVASAALQAGRLRGSLTFRTWCP
jgi:GT2 family glycosyltransferase